MKRRIEEVLSRAIGVDAQTLGRRSTELAAAARAKARHVTLEQYVALLADPHEMQAFVELLVVPETWFFRIPAAFRLLSKLASAPPVPAVFRVLTFPCSTGEEPYSAAMAMLDAGKSPRSFSIDAADVSAHALERARVRTFGRSSFRNHPGSFIHRYFQPAGSTRRVLTDERVWGAVRFTQANLTVASSWPAGEPYHAIFCRNALIYLHRRAQHEVLVSLRSRLAPGGTLFVGEGEGGLALAEGWRPLPGGSGAIAFRFEAGRDLHATRARPRAGPARTTMAAPIPPRASRPVHPPEPEPLPAIADQSPLSRARVLADAGNLSHAEQLCRQHLAAHPKSADAYHLLGLLREASGAVDEAASLYRKALYLDPKHTETIRHIALILDGHGGERRAERLRRLSVLKDDDQ